MRTLKMKYSITDNTKIHNGVTLYQIKAEKDFGIVKKGDFGGWVASGDNLSQYDSAWVSGNAKVYGHAKVFGDASVSGDAKVSGSAQVFGYALVFDNAKVYEDAKVSGKAKVFGNYLSPTDQF